MKVLARIYTSKGSKRFEILRGKVFCTRGGGMQPLRRSGTIGNTKGALAIPDGTRVVELSLLGYDSCDVVR